MLIGDLQMTDETPSEQMKTEPSPFNFDARLSKLEEKFDGLGKSIEDKFKPLSDGVENLTSFFKELIDAEDDEPKSKAKNRTSSKSNDKTVDVNVDAPPHKKKLFGKLMH